MAWDLKKWPWSAVPGINEDSITPANPSPHDLRASILGNEDYALGRKIDTARELKDYQVAAAYSVVYTKVARYRKDIISEVEKLREFYLTDVMVSQFADDALSPDVVSNEIVTVWSEKEEINKELEYLQEKIIDFDDLVLSITPDIIANGEYTLATKVDADSGVMELSDSVDQTKVIPLERNGEIEGFLVQTGNKLHIAPPSDFIKFSLGSKKLRIDLYQEYSHLKSTKSELKNIPRYIRVGKSFLYPVRAKIKELELLEQLVPATKISKLSQGTVVGVSVPGGYDVEKAMEAAKRMEGLLNKKVGVDMEKGQITLENIMTSAGRLKVIPIFGDKGELRKFDYKQDEPDELLASVNDIRKVICDSVGIPYELIFSSESTSKNETLRRYARYVRKLKGVQHALADGIRQIAYVHLSNKGISFVPDDIHVDFKNKLVEIDNLNKLEFLDTTIGMLKNARDFIYELKGEESYIRDSIRITVFKDFLREQFGMVGLRGLIDETPEEQEKVRFNMFDPGDAVGPELPGGAGPSSPSGGKEPAGAKASTGSGDQPGAHEPNLNAKPGPEVMDIEDLGNEPEGNA